MLADAPADTLDAPAPQTAPLPELLPGVWESLFPYQRAGIAKSVRRRNFHQWAACGAGKTGMACAWAVAEPGPVLVVTRGGVREQWATDEIPRWIAVEPFILRPLGEREAGDESLAGYMRRVHRPLVVMGWSGLIDARVRTEIEPLLKLRPSLVLDELHVAKDWRHVKAVPRKDGGKDFIALDTTAAWTARIAKRAKRRLGLTATPIYNARSDLWAQLNAVEPGMVGRSPWPWLQTFCGAYRGEWGMVTDGASNTDALVQWLRPRTHVVTAEEVWEGLPPCTRLLTVVPRAEQGEEDPAAREALFVALRGTAGLHETSTRGAAAYAAVRAARFNLAASRKRPAIVERARAVLTRPSPSTGGPPKMLIFTGLRIEVDILGDMIQKAVPQAKVWAADGGTPPRERERIRRAYMDEPEAPACIVGTGDSWGDSASLQRTDVQVIAALPWTWGQIRQWEGRTRRKRQDRAVVVEYLFAEGTADERVFPKVCAKLSRAGDVIPDAQIDLIRSTLAGGSDEELIDELLDEFDVGSTP